MTLYDLIEPHLNRHGIDIHADYHVLPSSQVDVLIKLGRLVYYKQPANANGSYGRCFFEKLQRQYRKEHLK